MNERLSFTKYRPWIRVKGVSTEGFESNFQMEEFIRNGNDEGNFLYGIQFKSENWSDPDSIPTVLGWFQNFSSLEVAPEHSVESAIYSSKFCR